MIIPEQCVECPYLARNTNEIARSQADIAAALNSGFETIDDQKHAYIDSLAETILIDRLKEINQIQAGLPLIPHDHTAAPRHLKAITDPETREKVFARYVDFTQGMFDIEGVIDDEDALRAAYMHIDTEKFLHLLKDTGKTSEELDQARAESRISSINLIDACQALINHLELRNQQAIERCANGTQVRRRYGLFGRDVIRCGSKLGYSRSSYSEISNSSA